MTRCLFLIFINFCLVSSSGKRAVQADGDEMETRSNISNYTTILPKTHSTTSTEAAVNTVHISTESKHLISASSGIPPIIPNACPRFHTGSFIGGMLVAFIILLVITVGYRSICSQQEIRYRVIEEHDAII